MDFEFPLMVVEEKNDIVFLKQVEMPQHVLIKICIPK